MIQDDDIIKREGEPDFIQVDEDDEELNKAMEQARKTVHTFIDALNRRPPGIQYVAIKKKFTEGEDYEYMWISSVTFDGTQFRGLVDNEPVSLENVHLGDDVLVSIEELADWMYILAGTLFGAYTIRVLMFREPPEARAEYEKEFGVTLEPLN